MKNQLNTLSNGLLFIFCLIAFPSQAASPNAPINLRTYDKFNPLGTDNRPYFGWYVCDSDDNEIQSAYQILIATSLSDLNVNKGDIWDSGKTSSRKQNHVYASGKPLSSATRYYWKVRTWDKDGNISPYSNPATFETGLLTNGDWDGAKWIKRTSDQPDIYTFFRKKAHLPNKTIKRAIAYITACHSYELYINGTFIGKGFVHHYPQYAYYHAWEITPELVSNAENLIACKTHWYGGGQGRAKGTQGLLVKIVVEYTDGTTSDICSDKTWKQAQDNQFIVPQPRRNGEGIGFVDLIDSRKVTKDWEKIAFDDSSWQEAQEIGTQPIAPWTGTLRSDLVRVIEKEIKPEKVTDLGNGKFVIDLGKVWAGRFKIAFSGGNAGDTIHMLGGFVAEEDGTVSRRLNQKTDLNYNFILNGGEAEFIPPVYLGLRYLEVENSPNKLTKENVSFISRHYEMDSSRSSFSSSNEMLNKVWKLMDHTLLVGAQEGFVDTPTREQGAFLSDGWSQSVPCMSVMGDRTLTPRSLREFLESQDQYWPDGRLNAVYPNVDGARDIPDFTQSYLVWVWDYYMQTGDEEFLKKNYIRLKKVADYVSDYINDTTGLVYKLKGGQGPYEFGIIDWPQPMRYGYDVSAESRTVIDAYAYTDFDILSKIAALVGKEEDKNSYRQKAEKMKNAINQYLLNDQGIYVDGINRDYTQSKHVSQQANILPMSFDLVPSRNIPQVVDFIKEKKMSVGMVCVRWLPEALGKADQGKHLIDLYSNTEWDGWAKTVKLGATTTWESWNANITNQSMSHPWGTSGLLGMQQYILGIKNLKPQGEFIQVKPLDFGNSLQHAEGKLPTDRGDIFVAWERKPTDYQLKLTIPDNMQAKVYIPKCGLKGNQIEIDGKSVQGIEEGNYLFIDNIGSGKHVFEKR